MCSASLTHCKRDFRRDLLLCVLLVSALVTPVSAEQTAATDLKIDTALALPRALPVVGEEQNIVARIVYHGQEPKNVTLIFSCEDEKSITPLGTPHLVALVPEGGVVAINQAWTPARTGRHTLTAVLKATPEENAGVLGAASQTIFAVKRPLYFHHWDMHPSLLYVTEGLVGKKEELDYWADRGVLAQRWCGAAWPAEAGIKTPQYLSENWGDACRQGWPGIVIDEFGGGDADDEMRGHALVEARKLQPKAHIAAYTLSIIGKRKIDAFRSAADCVLVEAYVGHAGYGYGRIQETYDTAATNGLTEKSLVALGLGSEWITTPIELRRQLHFIRYRYPDMPGVAFFGVATPLYSALNSLIEEFYLGPVLRVEAAESGLLRVQNIGGSDSPSTKVTIRLGNRFSTKRIAVPPLVAGQSREIAFAGKSAHPVSEFREGCFILGPPLLWDKEPANFRRDATAPWPKLMRTVSTLKEAFAVEPQWETEFNSSGKESIHANVAAASFPITSTERRGCELRFDLKLTQPGHYGHFQVSLSGGQGKSLLELSFYRGDHESAPYPKVLIKNPCGFAVEERIAAAMEVNKPYQFVVSYVPESQGFVRVAIRQRGGQKVWDSGAIPTYGDLTFDRLRFGILNGSGSALRWDPHERAIFLCGADSSDPAYALAGYIDNVEIATSAPRVEPPKSGPSSGR